MSQFDEKNTALHWACFSGSYNITKQLLDAGCCIEAVNRLGDRPLHVAAREGHYEITVLLLLRGAHFDCKNNDNLIPLECCNENSETWRALRINKELYDVRKLPTKVTERLLHRDISLGKERFPLPVYNGIDDDDYPKDFHYVTENESSVVININRTITSLRSCSCKDNCSSPFCECARGSSRLWYTKDGRLAEDFEKQTNIFECNKACSCWSNCRNRVVQSGSNYRLAVFKTQHCGWGVRSTSLIPKGAFVCEYIGEYISDAEAENKTDDTYLFDLDQSRNRSNFSIDGKKFRNVGPIINHSCNPNVLPVTVYINIQDLRFPRICFFAARQIDKEEELGFDYGHTYWRVKKKFFHCACGYSKCKYKDNIGSRVS